MTATIALVVPSINHIGGIATAASFVKDVVVKSQGFELRIVSMATSMRDRASLRLASPTSWRRGAHTQLEEWQGLPVRHVGAVFSELEFQRYRRRKALTKAIADCDVLQVVCGTPAWANALVGLGRPVSLLCATRARIERRMRDTGARGLLDFLRRAMTGVTDSMDDRAMRSVDAIQVMNPSMLEYARDITVKRNVDLRYAPPGINADTFVPASGRNLDRDPYLLCVGRLDDPRKNIGLLLDAYSVLPEATKGRMRLVLAGQSSPPDRFFEQVEAKNLRDRVEFIMCPSRDQLVDLYQRASMFALPSDEEGFGLVLLEAMACGIPVVSTRSGGPDGIIVDGYNGYLVPLDDQETLAERIELLSRDKARNRELGRQARSTIELRYAQEPAGEPFLDTWTRLIHKANNV